MIVLIMGAIGVTVFCFLYGYYSYGILSSISAYLFFNDHYFMGFMPLLWSLWNHINIDHISDNNLFLQIFMIITLFLIRHNI